MITVDREGMRSGDVHLLCLLFLPCAVMERAWLADVALRFVVPFGKFEIRVKTGDRTSRSKYATMLNSLFDPTRWRCVTWTLIGSLDVTIEALGRRVGGGL